MLINVLTRLAADTGFHPVQKRNALIKLLQQSGEQLHRELECSKIYKECTLVVPPDAIVSLPSFVGELRGMRMTNSEIPFDLANIGQPRYTSSTLSHWYKNWRDLGESPLAQLIANAGQLAITCNNVEATPVSLSINGQTNIAERDEETVLLNSVSKTTTKQFGPAIYTIGCVSDNRTCDIVIKDTDASEIATLHSWQSETRYKIVDVSKIFWPNDTSDGKSLIDILYKVPATRMFRDSDSFYAGADYEDAWYNMAMYYHLRRMQNRGQEAVNYQKDALAVCQSAKDSGEGQQIKKLSFGRNKFYGHFHQFRSAYPGVTNVDNNP